MGRNAAAVVREEVSRGIRSSAPESTAASTGFLPSPIWTRMDSDMTMALSTSMPKAMMRAARDIWSMPMPRNDMTSRLRSMERGMRGDTASPARIPMPTSMTARTIPTACRRFETKSSTFRATCSGWKATKSNSIPIG